MIHEVEIHFRELVRNAVVEQANRPVSDNGSAADGDEHVRAAAMREAETMIAEVVEQKERERQVLEDELRQLGSMVVGLRKSADEVEKNQRRRLEEMQQVAAELAVAVASALLHVRIQAEDYGIEEIVRNVARQLEAGTKLTMYLHPADFRLLHRRLGDAVRDLSDGNAQLEIDESLERGSCRAETGDCTLLSRLEDQLQGMREHLLATLGDSTNKADGSENPSSNAAMRNGA